MFFLPAALLHLQVDINPVVFFYFMLLYTIIEFIFNTSIQSLFSKQ